MAGVQAGPTMLGGEVGFDVPVDVAFRYLADPRNRPEWQSSLRRVEVLDDGEPRVGTRWLDHTSVGLTPAMTITALVPDELWWEDGVWRGIRAVLQLHFAPRDGGCRVEFCFAVVGRGVLRPLGWVATGAGVLAVRSDLRRANRKLVEGN